MTNFSNSSVDFSVKDKTCFQWLHEKQTYRPKVEGGMNCSCHPSTLCCLDSTSATNTQTHDVALDPTLRSRQVAAFSIGEVENAVLVCDEEWNTCTSHGHCLHSRGCHSSLNRLPCGDRLAEKCEQMPVGPKSADTLNSQGWSTPEDLPSTKRSKSKAGRLHFTGSQAVYNYKHMCKRYKVTVDN